MDAVVPIGEQAPLFELPDLYGHSVSLIDYRGYITVLNFWSAECSWCERVDRELVGYIEAWEDRVKVLWIASNTHEPREMIEKAAAERDLGVVLLDADQQIANRYRVQTTPHFFVISADGKLTYQGAWDDITFRQRVATQHYVPQVIEAMLNNQSPAINQTHAYGCVLVRFNPDKH